MNLEERFRDYLKNKGLKFTPERRLIFKEIISFKEHFDIDKLYGKIRRKNKLLSLATIYRTLPHLVNSGLIKEVLRSQRKSQYEKNYGFPHHDHLICIRCRKITGFKEEEIERLQDKVCSKYGFRPLEHYLGIKGYCKSCQTRMARR